MTDRDRLIELMKWFAIECHKPNCKRNEKDCRIHAFEQFADYLLANGVTVFPVPIGSTVYEIRATGVRRYGKHRKYDYSPDTTFSLKNAISQKATLYIATKKFCKTDKARLNKTVFLTKEEAEAELEKRGKENEQTRPL